MVTTDMEFHLIQCSKNNQHTKLLTYLYTSSYNIKEYIINTCKLTKHSCFSFKHVTLCSTVSSLPLLCIAFDSEWKSSIVPNTGAMSLKS